jgi:hypothetical protein
MKSLIRLARRPAKNALHTGFARDNPAIAFPTVLPQEHSGFCCVLQVSRRWFLGYRSSPRGYQTAGLRWLRLTTRARIRFSSSIAENRPFQTKEFDHDKFFGSPQEAMARMMPARHPLRYAACKDRCAQTRARARRPRSGRNAERSRQL